MVRVRVTSITVSDGTQIPNPAEGTVLLVGPNNAGKSQTLKDIVGLARNHQYTGKTVTAAEFEKADGEGFGEWVTANVPQVFRDGFARFRVEGWSEVGLADVVGQWSARDVGVLTSIFFFHADGTTRLTAGNSQSSLDFSTQAPTHPIHRAYNEPWLEVALDTASSAAFGLGITVDRYSGSVISLRLGARPHFAHEDGRPTPDYLQALRSLPRLEDQGDGVRSYIGLLLHVIAGAHQVMLIDEPEAFLHPPQARLLGEALADRGRTGQVFIATHSGDVVRGALESDASTTIVRVTREGNVNRASVLVHDAVRELWSDPLLRYSNIFDGLFHDAVVLCESDSDCRYYSAVMEHLDTADDATGPDGREPQILFTHCGGKARMPSVIGALKAVRVPVVVVADFDVLRDAGDVERIVSALGGDHSTLEHDLHLVSAALSTDARPLRALALKDELTRRIDALPGETLTAHDAVALRSIIRVETGWDKAKRAGLSAVPQGPPSESAKSLLAKLTEIGLLVVPVGELERFAPAVPGHGPSWVTKVLEQKLHLAPSPEAGAFVRAIRTAAAGA